MAVDEKILIEVLKGIITFFSGVGIAYLKISNDNENLSTKFKNDLIINNKEIEAANNRLLSTFNQENIITNRKLSAEYMTNKRIDWIWAVRNEIAEFSSISYNITLINNKSMNTQHLNTITSDEYKKLNTSLAKIQLFLNPNGGWDKEIYDVINKITNTTVKRTKSLDILYKLLKSESRVGESET